MRRLVGPIALCFALAACSAVSTTPTSDAFCHRVADAAQSFGHVDARSIRAVTDTMIGLAREAPPEIAADIKVMADALARLEPYFSNLESGQLSWNDFGRQHLSALAEDSTFVRANENVSAYVNTNCGARPPSTR